MPEFDLDPHPGRPRILFIGWPATSHTQLWIDLLQDTSFNVRLFCLAAGEPPRDWPVRCYLTAPEIPRCDGPTRRTVYPPPPSSPYYAIYLYRAAQRVSNLIPKSGLGGALSGAAAALDRLYARTYSASLE